MQHILLSALSLPYGCVHAALGIQALNYLSSPNLEAAFLPCLEENQTYPMSVFKINLPL